MRQQRRKYVEDLKAWDLPRLEEFELKLVEELAGRARTMYFDRDLFAEEFYPVFLDRLRELAGTAVFETIEYWMKGLADGSDGEFPELCFEFPYLQRYEDVEVLTLAYCVDNGDGSRTELNRVTLDGVLMQILENDPPARMRRRAQATVAKLRDLAEKLEKLLARSRLDGLSLVPAPPDLRK